MAVAVGFLDWRRLLNGQTGSLFQVGRRAGWTALERVVGGNARAAQPGPKVKDSDD